jgi:phosphopantetheinyl transferase (holo-ACP synthase)
VISIGNDIIALDIIDAGRTIQPVFYSRILDPAEAGMYAEFPSLPFEHYVWLLWSIKESVYKCIKRKQPELRFSPRKIIIKQIRLSDTYRSLVYFNSMSFYAESRVNEKFISTLATNDEKFDGNTICCGVRQILQTDPESQSQQVRSALLDRLQSFFPGDQLQIEKAQAGFPILVRNSTPTHLPISFSHHHNLVFYSFIFPFSPS